MAIRRFITWQVARDSASHMRHSHSLLAQRSPMLTRAAHHGMQYSPSFTLAPVMQASFFLHSRSITVPYGGIVSNASTSCGKVIRLLGSGWSSLPSSLVANAFRPSSCGASCRHLSSYAQVVTHERSSDSVAAAKGRLSAEREVGVRERAASQRVRQEQESTEARVQILFHSPMSSHSTQPIPHRSDSFE